MRSDVRLVEDMGAAWIIGADPVAVDEVADRLRREGRSVSQRRAVVVVRRNGVSETTYLRLCTSCHIREGPWHR